MDGLECREVLLSEALNYIAFRLDSHFYEKKYVLLKSTISRYDCMSLKQLVSKAIQTGHTPPMSDMTYYGGNIALIKTDNLHDNYIIANFSHYLSDKGNALISRTTLNEGDIITTIIGATEDVIARSAMIGREHLPANINQNIVQIRIDAKKAIPEYVYIYLGSMYGKQYFTYFSRQTEQVNLNCAEIEKIAVPILERSFQKSIKSLVHQAHGIMLSADMAYRKAQQSLLDDLRVDVKSMSSESIAIKGCSESFAISGRLDAEYYLPKYESIQRALNAKDTVRTLCKLHDRTFLPKPNEEYRYIELADVGTSGFIADVESQRGVDLPTRARRKVKRGQVIVSSVEGSLQSCALITDEYDNALCSTGFYVVDSAKINPETLLVLFKSEPIQALMKQRCSGTILTAISKDEFLSMPLPFIGDDVQSEIARKVQESFSLRRQSEKLIETAVRAVEIAIERDEAAAVEWLNQANAFITGEGKYESV